MQHLANVLKMLKDNNLKTNLEKCHFSLSQDKLLGKSVKHTSFVYRDHELAGTLVRLKEITKGNTQVKRKQIKVHPGNN